MPSLQSEIYWSITRKYLRRSINYAFWARKETGHDGTLVYIRAQKKIEKKMKNINAMVKRRVRVACLLAGQGRWGYIFARTEARNALMTRTLSSVL